ncbi:MAG: glycerol-3-phosphate dehydrogenase/oxidase [Myxococcales bacterium]|nr:glycerol-3-phosphate dehydrogenase/oxidase [Polyangiaceae bacterium]MDW8247986.1 glycerol-3-phosphate dehydrogenase/oxidase [Myxococcales bacterium]
MWTTDTRARTWAELERPWDLIVLGGGITGAGVLAEASRRGLRGLLLEARDFAFGTSSRSSKLVHGGLRYLRQAQIRLTRTSVREREELLRGAEGLVAPLGFYVANFQGDTTSPWMFGLGLAIYDVLARKWAHEKLEVGRMLEKLPVLQGAPLVGGYYFYDAQTDDTRLVMRVLLEAARHGGVALNYTRALKLLRDGSGRVVGVVAQDESGSGRTAEVRARAVVNATGVWADDLRASLGRPRRLRAIRGSHLVFPATKLPVPEAISLLHPRDSRAVFLLPWQGATVVGTTDVDHKEDLWQEPSITPEEIDYLLELVHHACPSLKLTADDVLSTWAGVRPVIDTGAADPSKESREHVVWNEDGLLTVTGGKLTTFRMMARQALQALQGVLPELKAPSSAEPLLQQQARAADWLAPLDGPTRQRLLGLYGADAPMVYHASPRDCSPIEGTPALWSELRWAARSEGVVHLDDLLLRRIRLGILLPEGGVALLERIRAMVQPELHWSDAQWQAEVERYQTIWRRSYGPPSVVGG